MTNSSVSKLRFVLPALALALVGFLFGMYLAGNPAREVDTSRARGCLEAYHQFRRSGNHPELTKRLAELNVSPREFEQIIDRFIHYRTSRSALGQAMRLLDAFRKGYDIRPSGVFQKDTDSVDTFQRDAEVLAVFQETPELVHQAFEG